MVAPSLVTMIPFPRPMLCRILSYEHPYSVTSLATPQLVCCFSASRQAGLLQLLDGNRTMPFGPSVDFTRSAMAIAPTNEACTHSGCVPGRL